MAEKESAGFWCNVCDLKFHWKSKFERHLASTRHQQQERLFSAVGAARLESASAVEETQEFNGEESASHFEEDISGDLWEDMDDDDLWPPPSVFHPDGEVNEWSEEEDTQCFEEMLQVCTSGGNDFKPFPSDVFTMLYMLVNSPRPMGESNLKFIWHLVSQLKHGIPSINTVKNFTLPGYLPPGKHYTSAGVPFYTVKSLDVLKLCLGNPMVAKMLRRYPVKAANELSRWWNDARLQAPMAISSCGHLYIGDFILFRHHIFGQMCGKVQKFYMKEGSCKVYLLVEMLLNVEQICIKYPRVSTMYTNPDSFLRDSISEVAITDVLSLQPPPTIVLDLNHSCHILQQQPLSEYAIYIQSHPMKALANGKPVFIVPLNLYTDDYSGNRSKKWNHFDGWTIILAGLPKHENAKLQNIHFLACSNKVSVLDMAAPIVKDLLELEKGVEIFDAHLGQQVIVIAPVLCILSDNPRASELLNHQGGAANLYCRICQVDKHVNPAQISTIRDKEVCLGQMMDIQAATSESEKARLRAKYGVKEIQNPLLSLSVDLYKSTPIETLHTILLGPYKYFLKDLMASLTKNQKLQFLALIASFDYSGFDVKIVGNICYHHKSFVGRDYKAWAQMAPFIVQHFVSPNELRLWINLSKVFMIAYCRKYSPDNYEDYKSICQTFVDSVQELRPRMMQKSKVHLLLHLADTLKEFGSTSACNTERCESFNSLMRVQNVYSNRQAPSRDVANSFSVLSYLRYLSSGGVYDGNRRCGEALKKFYESAPVQHYLNGTAIKALSSKGIYQPGTLRKKQISLSKLGDVTVVLKSGATKFSCLPQEHLPTDCEAIVAVFTAVVSQNGALVNVGSAVRVSSTGQSEVEYGVLIVSIALQRLPQRYCIIQKLEPFMSSNNEEILNEFECPILTLTDDFYAVLPDNVQSPVSVVHQCDDSCSFIQKNSTYNVEREAVSKHSLVFEHDWSNRMYCLNVFCMNQ